MLYYTYTHQLYLGRWRWASLSPVQGWVWASPSRLRLWRWASLSPVRGWRLAHPHLPQNDVCGDPHLCGEGGGEHPKTTIE